ncbi:hypothetical protein IJ818_02245 [bacterium]|nr:hypothetical protein [bacterium]
MKKEFLILYILIALFIMNSVVSFAVEDLQLRDYSPITIPKGTYVQVMNLQEFSTSYCDDTTKLKFAATDDTYMYDTNIIPKGTVIFGEVEKMNEPIVGTNASVVVKLTKLQLADGFEIPIKAYLAASNGSTLLGGDVTKPEQYRRLPHYQEGLYKGTLMWVPGPTLKMGEHLTIAAGAVLLMVFDSPAYITHTLTN